VNVRVGVSFFSSALISGLGHYVICTCPYLTVRALTLALCITAAQGPRLPHVCNIMMEYGDPKKTGKAIMESEILPEQQDQPKNP